MNQNKRWATKSHWFLEECLFAYLSKLYDQTKSLVSRHYHFDINIA